MKSEGYEINTGQVYETIFLLHYSNSLLLQEVLTRQIELEKRIKGEPINGDSVLLEVGEIVNRIAAEATDKKNSLIADLYIKNKSDED